MPTKAEILITARDQTNTAFKSVERSLAGLQTASVGVSSAFAALSTAGVVGFARTIINDLDKLNDLSKTTGLAVNQLAGLGFAAKQSGSDLDGVAASVSKLSVNIGKDADKFRALGITAKDPLEAFKQLADIFVSIKDPQERAAVAAAALGKSWQSAAPLLSEGGAAIGRMVSEGTKASGVTKEMAEAADKFNGELELMKTQVIGVAASLTGNLLPALNSGLTNLKNIISPEEDMKMAVRLNYLRDSMDSILTRRKLLSKVGIDSSSFWGSELEKLNAEAVTLEKSLNKLQSTTAKVESSPKAPSNKAIASFLGNNTGSDNAKAALQREQSAIQALRDRLAATKQLTELETIGDQIRQGKFADVSASGKQQLLILAAQIDSTRTLNQAEKDQADAQKKATEEGIARFKSLEEAGRSVYEATRTDAQKYADEVIRLNDLLAQGAISQETYNVALQKTQDEYIKAANKASTASVEMSQFAVQAARDMQTSFANFLFDPFDKGLTGMLTGFLDVMRRMAAEAASRRIIEAFVGASGGGGDLLGGVVGTLFSGARKIFGFADGGFHSGGLRLVGENGPELEVTGPSRIYNAADTQRMLSGGRGGDNITVQVYVQTGVQQTVRAEFLSLIPTIRKEAVAAVAQAKQRGTYGGALS
jgi:hypothetical protein